MRLWFWAFDHRISVYSKPVWSWIFFVSWLKSGKNQGYIFRTTIHKIYPECSYWCWSVDANWINIFNNWSNCFQGYIKDYEGATLMGCELNPKIVYTEFSLVVRKQKEILKKLIERKQAQIRKVHPGLTCYREGVREIPIESIPGMSNSFISVHT